MYVREFFSRVQKEHKTHEDWKEKKANKSALRDGKRGIEGVLWGNYETKEETDRINEIKGETKRVCKLVMSLKTSDGRVFKRLLSRS